MAYYIVNVAVKWANGDLEGFSSSGLDEATARKRAIDKAHNKAASFAGNCTFDVLTKTQYNALSIEQQDELQADWDSESK